MINTIIFDFGGVLGTNSDTILFNILSKLGHTKEEFSNFWTRYWPDLKINKLSVDSFWGKAEIFFNEDIQTVKSEYKKLISIDPKMLNLSKRLKSLNYKLGILANESCDWMKIKRRKGNLDDIFGVTLASADLEVAKPDSDAFTKTLKALKSKPSESLFIDDLERNTKAAKELGMETILFQDIDKLKAYLERRSIL